MRKEMRVLAVTALAVGLAFGISACGSKKKTAEEGMAATPTTSVQEGMTGMAPADESLDAQSRYAGASNILEGRSEAPFLPIYFDFDKSDVRADQQERLEKNAMHLRTNSAMAITIEGNCDERGTNEYNMALGERRAQAAKKYLMNLGIEAGRLNTVSFGEEKPLLFGHDELSWAQNRRDDFTIVR